MASLRQDIREIMSVTGPLRPEDLGVTHIHEHLMADCSFSGNDQNKKYDDVDTMIDEVGYFRTAGGKTIVEQTCRGLGQNALALRRIAEASGVQIIAATGFYRSVVYPSYVESESADQLAARMIRDFTDGIEDTGVRPGIIAELGAEGGSPHLTPDEVKVFRAAARAAGPTGMAISTHCWAGETAMDMIRVLSEEGVVPGRILIGHLGTSNAIWDRTLQVADTGVFFGIDSIGYDLGGFGDEDRADIVRGLIDRGHLRQIAISQDMMRGSFLKCRGGHGYDHLLNSFVPLLKQRGVDDQMIHVMLVETPRRLLTLN